MRGLGGIRTSAPCEDPPPSLSPYSVWVSSHIPKGEEHGRSMIEEETIAIFFWDGSPMPEFAE